jgi:hypothetical protein
MREHDRARAFAAGHDPAAASIGELVAMAAFSAPCCGHIALCDGACRDTPSPGLSFDHPRPGKDVTRYRASGDRSL